MLLATKVYVPNLDSYLEWTPIFEWCVVGCELKNKYENNMYRKEFVNHLRHDI